MAASALVGNGNATGEWATTAKIPDRPADEETSTNLFVHLPCEPYDEARFRTAANYMQDSALVGVVKPDLQQRFVHSDHLGRPEVVSGSAQQVVWAFENA